MRYLNRQMMPHKKSTKSNLRSLSIEDADIGARRCIDTAKRFIQAARLLSHSGFLELASFTLCTAIEEVGKAFLLMDFQEEKFEGRKDASQRLAQSFFWHSDKLESALIAWKRDELFFKALQRLNLEGKPEAEIIDQFTKLLHKIRLPDLKPQTKKTFQKRNELLYTNFKDGNFIAPKNRARRETYRQLLDIAEKTAARAALEWAIGKICFRRGAPRTQLAQIVLKELPNLYNEVKARLPDLRVHKG